MAPILIHCLLCESSTLEESLLEHLQYNHMVYKKTLRNVLHNLHFPPVDQQLLDRLATECENEAAIAPTRNHNNLTPFATRRKRSVSKENGRRRKESPFQQSKRLKTERSSPPSSTKKPILLKKTTPARKKLQSNLDQMMNDNPIEDEDQPVLKKIRKKSGEVNYDTVYASRENQEKATNNAQKIRQLQQNELQCTMDQGTYVQCCECNKWRMVREIEDPALVPEYWVCNMNSDQSINDCSKGEGDDVESDEEFVSVEYTCGSLVWIKFPGYPWWPGMVDYCPEKEDTFLVDERVNSRVAAKYHVVFFDRAQNVARAWVERDNLSKLAVVEEPPKNPQNFKNDAIKKRYQLAKEMAKDALSLPRIERIEKYSFVSLFTGKWGDLSEEEEDFERRNMEIDVDARLVGVSDFRQPDTPVKKKPAPRKLKRKKKIIKEKRFLNSNTEKQDLGWEEDRDFHCLRCQKDVRFSQNFVSNHLRRHRLELQEYLTTYECQTSADQLHRLRQWVQSKEYLSRIEENARERRKSKEGGSIRESVDSALTANDGELESLLDDPDDRAAVEGTDTEQQKPSNNVEEEQTNHVEEPNGDLEEEIPIEIPLEDLPLTRSEEEDAPVVTKDEPVDSSETNEQVMERPLERVPLAPSAGSPVPPERRLTEDDPHMDSMDRLRRDLEKLANKGRTSGTETRPLRKTGGGEDQPAAGDEDVEMEVKQEGTWYCKPPMSPELLIAIAVRNLDPHKEVGASCSDIVAFISLHFPYFNNNYEECKDMVRRECGMSSGFESGRENFQMRAEINCGDRIHSYVQNNRERICQAMLEPLFLDVIIDRFVAEERMVSPSSRRSPPFSSSMLTHLALLKLPQRATLEQIVILLKFLFPALAKTGVMEAYRREFLEVIAKSSELDARVEKNNITFSLREEHKESVLSAIKKVSLDNLDTIGEALLHENFFDIILPIFQNND